MITPNKKPFYITFGTADHFPYGIKDYVVSYAENERDACEAFRTKYPDVHAGLYNFASIYDQDSWESGIKNYYEGKEPVDTVEKKGIFLVAVEVKDNYPYPCGIATSEENAKAMIEDLKKQDKELWSIEDGKYFYSELSPDRLEFFNGSIVNYYDGGKVIKQDKSENSNRLDQIDYELRIPESELEEEFDDIEK